MDQPHCIVHSGYQRRVTSRRWYISNSARADFSPAPAPKLPEGWHRTAKFGDIFVSPSGRAWGVKIIGTKFQNVVVDVRAADFIGQSVIERRKEAVRKSVRRQSVQGQRTNPPILRHSEKRAQHTRVLEDHCEPYRII